LTIQAGTRILTQDATDSLTRALATGGLENIARLTSKRVLFGQSVSSRLSNRSRFPLVNPNSHKLSVAREAGLPRHRHSWPELGVVLKGRLNAAIDHTLYEARKGDWLIVRPHIAHGEFCLESQAEYCVMWFGFTPDFFLSMTRWTPERGYGCELYGIPKCEDAGLGAAISAMFEDPSQPPGRIQLTLARLAVWWLEMLHPPPSQPDAPAHSLVEKVERILQTSARRLPSVAELAKRLGLSVSHLSRQFHARTGQTLHHAILGSRIERARRYLADPSLPMKEIAYLLGFATSQHFSAVFRRFAGVSPTAFRLELTTKTDT
jgi:AraC-like DNA-binding protein